MSQELGFIHDNAIHDSFAERTLMPYIDELKKIHATHRYGAQESSINCSDDRRMHQEIMNMVAKKTSPKLRYVVVVGIGGSFLGAKAVYEAVRGIYDSVSETYPKLVLLDTISARDIMAVVDMLASHAESKEEFLINVISKSGTTTETVANLETLCDALSVRFGDIADRIVITTDENSVMWKAAGKHRIARLPIPKNVGGRFSAMSAVGQFPLACVGIDVRKWLNGAHDMLKKCLQKKNNPAVRSASIIYHYRTQDIRIHNTFLFNPELEWLGKWYRQLMAESLGKRENEVGIEVREGILPIVSVGSSDLHAMLQFYLGGPNMSLTSFVYAKQLPTQVKVPKKKLLGELVQNIEGVSYKKIMEAIYEGTKAAYTEHGLSYMEITMGRIDEYAIGQFMQWKMCETMCLARLLNINAFNQPNVEDYKKVTRSLLKDAA